MALEKLSPCKVNLLLNILGRRTDGFHELETVMHPVDYCDRLRLERHGVGLTLECSHPALATDSTNLVHRAATAFLNATGITDGVRLHLEKRIPMAAGLGGGSSNAAATLAGLNELFNHPLSPGQLTELAARLGSDVPFFLQDRPALGVGRGEQVQSLAPFPALVGAWFVLFHPGFGIATAWAYQNLARFPEALNGRKGRAQELIARLQTNDLVAAGQHFYNSLEAPALEKFPILALYKEFFREQGAAATLMSGSGSTTFALVQDRRQAEHIVEQFPVRFGTAGWLAWVPA